MGFHNDIQQGYGLYLTEEEGESFIHKYATANFLEDVDVCDELEAVHLDDEFTGFDIFELTPLDGKAHKEYNDEFMHGYFLYAEKQGCIVLDHSNDAYANLSEMADEFRQAYGNYLPDDFDYVAHLCFMLGANFG